MSWTGFVRLIHLAVLLAMTTAAFAQGLTLDRLQRLLQAAPPAEVRFTELRESRWLAAPIESSGTMRTSATMLEKQVEQPQRETWRILGDRMQLIAPGEGGTREILFDRAPAAAVLAQTMRRIIGGNLATLNDDFQLELSGDERHWSLRLTPRHPDVARQLEQISLQGAGRRLSIIVILDRQGNRTTTRFQYPE